MTVQTMTPSIFIHNAVSGSELKAWNSAGEVCPNCRHSAPVTAAPSACCPVPAAERHALQFTPSIPKFKVPRIVQLFRLKSTINALTLSGWYHKGLDWQGARTLLRDTSPGTFIVRASGDKRFIFSLSVQTEFGPTSVRLQYEGGLFWLDCHKTIVRLMPTFQCAIELIQHYVSCGREGVVGTVWVDATGCPHSPVYLRSGLRSQPASLVHLSRLAIHRALNADKTTPKISTAPKYQRLPLPRTLIEFLAEYPYSC